MKGGDKIHLKEASIVIENIDLEFTLYDSGIKPIARTLLGPLERQLPEIWDFPRP